MRELLDKLRDAVLPPKNRFLEILGFSLESGMDLRSSVAAARTHVETLADHHRVNMLEAAIERGEGLIEALLEADLVGIDELSDLRLAEESGFLAMTLTKMGQKAPKSALLKSVDVSGKTMVGVYLVFLAGGIGWVFISML